MPIPCADIVIVSRGKFLLGKRKNKPAQGKWWLVGGRINKGEHLRHAALRHVRIETGIPNAVIVKLLGAGEGFFRGSAQGPSSHSIGIVFLVKVPYKEIIKPADSENAEFAWFSKIDKKWAPYVKEMLGLAGFT